MNNLQTTNDKLIAKNTVLITKLQQEGHTCICIGHTSPVEKTVPPKVFWCQTVPCIDI